MKIRNIIILITIIILIMSNVILIVIVTSNKRKQIEVKHYNFTPAFDYNEMTDDTLIDLWKRRKQ